MTTRGRGTTRRRFSLGLAGTLATPALSRAASDTDTGMLREVSEHADGLNQLNSLIVAQRGEVLLSRAYRGPSLDRPVNLKSVSKTLVATLAGIAIDKGVLSGVDQPIAPLLADRIPAGADPCVEEITVGHLLTMQAGLERTSGPNYGAWVSSSDWVAYALGRPKVADPGSRMLYSTGSYHVLGVALARAAGKSLLGLARDWLGTPLGIDIPPWTRDPQGDYMGGNNMALSPRDFLLFGEMMRLNGEWQGQQVVSQNWIRKSWQPRTHSPFSGSSYGYGWFLLLSDQHPMAYARGYGGQMLFVLPSLDLTVAVTSDPNRPARTAGHAGDLLDMVTEQIVPALSS